MSTFTKTTSDDYTLYQVFDYETERGWFRLDIDGVVHITAKQGHHFWIAPDDGEPYTALRDHLSAKSQTVGEAAIFGTAAERKDAERVMGRPMFRQPSLGLEGQR